MSGYTKKITDILRAMASGSEINAEYLTTDVELKDGVLSGANGIDVKIDKKTIKSLLLEGLVKHNINGASRGGFVRGWDHVYTITQKGLDHIEGPQLSSKQKFKIGQSVWVVNGYTPREARIIGPVDSDTSFNCIYNAAAYVCRLTEQPFDSSKNVYMLSEHIFEDRLHALKCSLTIAKQMVSELQESLEMEKDWRKK